MPMLRPIFPNGPRKLQKYLGKYSKLNLRIILSRVLFSRFWDFCGNLGNVKEKSTRKTCFSREMKRLAPRIYLAKFC